MGNLIQISANVPQEFMDDKNNWGVSWAYIIREGIKSMKLQERLMNQKVDPDQIEWRIRAKEKIEEALRMVK